MNKLICVVGMTGSGKSVISDELVKKGFKFLRFGQLTLDTLKEKNMEINEENERFVRENLRKEHGMGAFAKLNIPKFDKLLEEGNVVGDGLYSWEEYKILKEKYGKNLIVLGVYSPPELRDERLEKRKLQSNDLDLRNRPTTKDQSKSRDYAEIENIDKGGPIAMADYLIDNTKDINFLLKQLDEILKKIIPENKIYKNEFNSDFLGRENYLSWDEYFMGVAILSSQRSKDPSTQVGACIVDEDKKIVGTGYNGAPRGIEDNDFPWSKEGDFMNTKYAYVCHSGLNAILNSTKESLKNCTMYVSLFPCNECAKAIIQSGIKKVVYISDKYSDVPAFMAARRLFEMAGIEMIKLNTKVDAIKLNFERV
jgi:dCMP deaminase